MKAREGSVGQQRLGAVLLRLVFGGGHEGPRAGT
jgi:hypothetical protein